MKCKFLLSTVSFIIAVIGFPLLVSASGNSFQYQINIKHGLDLSELYRGPLQLQAFSDTRNELQGKQISDAISLDSTAADIVRDAIAQAFAQGGATLVEQDPQQVFTGEITEFKAETETSNGEAVINVTVRAKLQLQSPSGKSYWQSTMLGRGEAPQSQGVNAALQQALDKFVNGLFYDDYLVMQLVE